MILLLVSSVAFGAGFFGYLAIAAAQGKTSVVSSLDALEIAMMFVSTVGSFAIVARFGLRLIASTAGTPARQALETKLETQRGFLRALGERQEIESALLGEAGRPSTLERDSASTPGPAAKRSARRI